VNSRIRRPLIAIAAAAALLGPSGCATTARSDYDHEVSFAYYHTFDWLAPPVRASQDEVRTEPNEPFAFNSLLDKRIRAAVDKNLEARGFEYVEGGHSDFRLNYHVTFRDKIVGSGTDFGYAGRYYRGGFSSDFNWSVRQYQEGTVIIDVIDRARDQLVWRGWMTRRSMDRNYDQSEIDDAVRKIMMRFPPGG
jgi:hypothetical protein